jgi:hypothetical protein
MPVVIALARISPMTSEALLIMPKMYIDRYPAPIANAKELVLSLDNYIIQSKPQ